MRLSRALTPIEVDRELFPVGATLPPMEDDEVELLDRLQAVEDLGPVVDGHELQRWHDDGGAGPEGAQVNMQGQSGGSASGEGSDPAPNGEAAAGQGPGGAPSSSAPGTGASAPGGSGEQPAAGASDAPAAPPTSPAKGKKRAALPPQG
ncbi:hypothetical protein VQH23_07430 [Pararoseomonas sp. SCSIO 73927]|uniref:hypothetical protein n=1 Tax=Pararoseomonas sp. SCSIO 73927 TaxID=3114537 RepID=UPI0030D3FD51